eukprot:scaffold19225_cov32-Prasinocladus_malaysianus.AAC.1
MRTGMGTERASSAAAAVRVNTSRRLARPPATLSAGHAGMYGAAIVQVQYPFKTLHGRAVSQVTHKSIQICCIEIIPWPSYDMMMIHYPYYVLCGDG